MNDMTDTGMNEPGSSTVEIESGTFTADQLAQLQEWAEADGWLPEEATGEAKEPGEAEQLDLQTSQPDVFGGEVNGTAYQFDQPADELTAMPMEEQKQIRAAMAAEGIPADIGNEMARRWNELASQPFNPEALTLSHNQGMADLERMHGDRVPEVIKAAKGEAERLIKHAPWLKTAIEQTPLGSCAWTISTLANLAQARGKGG
jgi:hypothetical protein